MTHQHSPHSQIDSADHAEGPESAPITLLEYGDYQCPDSRSAHSVVKELQQELGQRLRFVYRHFPLTRIHKYAEMAAEAAEAAGAQNRFWDMHDVLFDNQEALGPDLPLELAKDLELDVERFADDVNGNAYSARIQRDVSRALQTGVHGTPTFFINGIRHQGAFDYETLFEAILEQTRRSAA